MVFLGQFPNTSDDPFIQTSHPDINYNCIAWAAEDNTRWYWPDPLGVYYWPPNLPRETTVEAIVGLYEYLGYEKCANGLYEERFIKIAVFSIENVPTHAARQLADGSWTSKLGQNIDVQHSIFSIEDGVYGKVVQYLKKEV